MSKTVTIAFDREMRELSLDELQEFQGNLKSLSDEDYARLKVQIEETGFAFPMHVWVDPEKNHKIVGGHQRLRVLQKMRDEGFQIPKLPTVFVHADSEREAKRRILQDASQYGKVERQGLYELAIEQEMDPGFLQKNFTMPEFALQWDDFTKEFFDDPTQLPPGDPDAVPEPPAEPKTKRGDIWTLGNHRLMCGDSTSITDMDALTLNVKAQLLVTDPPYGVSYVEKNAAVNGGIVKNAIGKTIENDSLDVDGMFKLWSDIFAMAGYFDNKASYYVFSPQGGELMMMMMMMMQAIHQSEWQLKHTLIWVKQNFVFGRADYHYQHEPILYGWKKKGTHNWYGDRKNSSVLNFDKAQRNDLHPTCKPVELLEPLISNSSKTNDYIVDLFGGSGSTLIACEKLNRKCFTMEISPAYCDVVLKRWADYTGKDPMRDDGVAWSSLQI